jgi:hypothetical protein
MQVGDSFATPQRINVSQHNIDGRHFIIRKTDDGYRIWRVA